MNSVRFRGGSLGSFERLVIGLGLVAAACWAQARVPNRAATSPPAAKKAIWEPINYPNDVLLADVYFVNDKLGWIAGKGPGGFIFHTSDGGEHWDVQMGDPHSNNPEVNMLRFLDATHGWAVQGEQLVRTTDGTTWETVGPFVPHTPLAQYRFISPQDGFELAGYYSGSTIFATRDGGRNWKPVYKCATTLQVNGLTRNTTCFLRDVYFASPTVGYAVGGGFNDKWAVVAKTVDGGATWKVIFASTDVDTASAVVFTDENNGLVRLHDGRVLITADGGQSWRGATGTAEAVLKFADPQVGWSCALQAAPSCSFTVDGGKSWTSQRFRFPAEIHGFSIPRRDRIYVVGEHGMIYRYRIVPADYTTKGILDAPLMPAYGVPLAAQLQQMQTQVAALETKLGAAGAAVSTGSGALAPATGEFTQDPAATGGGFAQAVSAAPLSLFLQGCCAAQLQDLQTSFTSVAQQVPSFSNQYRNLNLLFVGLNMRDDMMGRAKRMGDQFIVLKQAANSHAAVAALSELSGRIQGTNQAIATQFQSLSAGPASGSAGGAIGNQLAAGRR